MKLKSNHSSTPSSVFIPHFRQYVYFKLIFLHFSETTQWSYQIVLFVSFVNIYIFQAKYLSQFSQNRMIIIIRYSCNHSCSERWYWYSNTHTQKHIIQSHLSPKQHWPYGIARKIEHNSFSFPNSSAENWLVLFW